jgi:hypothetical protein
MLPNKHAGVMLVTNNTEAWLLPSTLPQYSSFSCSWHRYLWATLFVRTSGSPRFVPSQKTSSQSRSVCQVQSTLPFVGIGLHNFKAMRIRIFADHSLLIGDGILLMLC